MWDAVLYVLTTRSLVAGEGYRVYGEPFHLRPPGFAFLLAPVVALFGDDFLAWNLFVSLLGILALALAFVYFHPRLGTPLTVAVCASLWINPQFQSLCNAVLADTAALAALFGCLLLDRRARRSETLGPLLERHGSRWGVDHAAVANAIFADTTLGAGQPIKITRPVALPD